MKMWAGRFKKETDKKVNDFNSSISFDMRLFKEDIMGSIAHSTMLCSKGIITEKEKEEIQTCLNDILAELLNGDAILSPDCEDIHMNIEQLLTERIGTAGKKLHTARSRNDQVALDIRMYQKSEILEIISLTKNLINEILVLATANTSTVMPGYTHLQRAQPITFAHHILAYAQMLRRDITRLYDCYDRTDEMPLGSGALATTTYDIDRMQVANLLGFKDITKNSLDGVSDRDFIIELLSDISIIMVHLSRFSEEIIFWCSWECKFIELDDAYSTGSSIMPQKKNPDIPELVRGKSGRVFGSLISILTTMKGLPLAYNKDMQEDKEALFNAIDTVKLCLEVFAPMLKTITINKDRMLLAAGEGFINATDCADYLVKKGLAFRDAYKITGELVALCIENKFTLNTLPLADYKAKCEVFDDDIYDAVNLQNCVNERKVIGGPSKSAVLNQIADLQDFIKDLK
ncbi:MAG: argininosuccinate lyase [Clostridia bacterium]